MANPIPYNALANGSWSGLLLYAAAPVLIGRLARASRLAPFGPVGGEPGPRVRAPSLRRDVLTIGLVTALVGAVLPSVLVITVVLAAAIVVGSFLVFTTHGDGRVLIAGVLGALVGALLHLPWTLDFVGSGATLASFLGIDRGEGTLGFDELLRFETGPIGAAPVGYVLLVAAALPLLIGRGWRHGWAVRGWTIALAFWGIAWAGQEGWLDFGLPASDVLLAPAAAGLALAAGLGVSAFELDLPGYRFGWRQLASGVAAVAVLVATLPVLTAAIDGAWSMPAGDPARALRSLDEAVAEVPSRILWLGDPDVLPLGGWELDPGLAYATTSRGTPPRRISGQATTTSRLRCSPMHLIWHRRARRRDSVDCWRRWGCATSSSSSGWRRRPGAPPRCPCPTSCATRWKHSSTWSASTSQMG